MKSLFNDSENNEIISRIKNLKSESNPEWGKMKVAQMLAHSQVPLMIALGDLKLKRSFIGILFGSIAKKKLVNDEPFKKNLPTDKKFIFTEEKNFQEEKDKLIGLIEKFNQSGKQGITKDQHPFFGEMSPEEWDMLMYKHLDHHLRQFGV